MELFHVTETINFHLPFEDGNVIPLQFNKPEGNLGVANIYAATGACVETFKIQFTNNKSLNITKDFKMKVLSSKDKKKIFGLDDFPVFLSNFDSSIVESDYPYTNPQDFKKIPSTKRVDLESVIEDIDGDEIKVFIVNGMGTGLGDGMIGLAALNIFYKKLQKKYKKIIIDLGQPSVIGDKAHQALYNQETIINSYSYLPITVEKLLDYDLIVDNSAMIIRENFPNNNMMDFYLENLGIDPASVPAEEKKIHIKKSELAERILDIPLKVLREQDQRLILLHLSASTPLRSMPRHLIKKAIKKIVEADHRNHVITWENIDDVKKDIDAHLGPHKSRHTNLSFKNYGFDFYTNLISRVDAVVSVDTSAYHIASAFEIPCVTIFQSIDPKIRVAYYPLCEGVDLDSEGKLRGIHISNDAKHMEMGVKQWESLNWKRVTDAITRTIKKKDELLSARSSTECPICGVQTKELAVDRYGKFDLIPCSHCKTEYSPIRKMADYDDMYEGDYTHYVSEDKSADQLVENYLKQTRFEPFIDLMQTLKGKNLSYLDFGCASGFLVEYAKRNGFDSYGVDISNKAIEFGQNKFKLGKRLSVGTKIQGIKGFPKKYDIISSIEVLEHLENPNDFAKEVAQSLNEGGYWFISTPNRNRIQFKCGVKNTKKHGGLESGDYPDEHLQRYRPESHRYIVEAAGLEVFHQSSCRIAAGTVADIAGPMPGVTINIPGNQTVEVPREVIYNFMLQYFQPMLDGTEGYGNFLVTIARKPKA